MTDARDDLRERPANRIAMALWMRSRATDLLRQCEAREQAASCMKDATAGELKSAAALGTRLGGRDVYCLDGDMNVSGLDARIIFQAMIDSALAPDAAPTIGCADDQRFHAVPVRK